MIITQAYQYAGVFSGVLVRKLLPWRTSTLLSGRYWFTSTPVRNYSCMLVQRYQIADYYSGIPVHWYLLWHTIHLYDNFLGGLHQYQYADYYFGVPVRWCLFWRTSTQVLLITVVY
jgi:hypothetical protein